MAHKIDSASGSITLISEDGSGNVNLTLPRAGLGTAASADTGTAAGNIPVLDGSGQIASGVLTNAAVADNAITLAKMAHGTDGELITYDATGAPANVAVGTSGQVLTSGGAGVAPTFQTAAGGGGKVLQVVSDFSATRVSVSTSTWTDVGLSVSITPSATTSKILLISSPFTLISGATATLGIRITRGSTGLIAFENITERWNHDQGQSISLTYIDSPRTTSSTTYTVQGNRSAGSGTCYFIQDAATTGGSSLIALEIGA